MADMVRNLVFFKTETSAEADVIIDALMPKVPELKGKVFSFESIIPRPADFFSAAEGRDFEKRFGYRTRCEWTGSEWGCERDAVGPEIDRTYDTHVVLRFATPWFVPLPIVTAMKKRFGDDLFLWLYSRETEDFVPDAISDLLDEGFDIEGLTSPKWETLDFEGAGRLANTFSVPEDSDDEDADEDDSGEDSDDDSYDDVISDCVQESLLEYFRSQSVDETVADIAARVAKKGFEVPLSAVEEFVWGEFWHHVKRHEGPFFCDANKAILKKDGRPTTVEEELDRSFTPAADDVRERYLDCGGDIFEALCQIESWDPDAWFWLHYDCSDVEASWRRLSIIKPNEPAY